MIHLVPEPLPQNAGIFEGMQLVLYGIIQAVPIRSSRPYWATTALYSQSFSESLQPRHGFAPAA